MIEKTEENRKYGCLAVYCNGWGECEEDWCEAEEWCQFHPNYKGGKKSH